MYCITVTLCFLQSSQNWEAENFLLSTMVTPANINTPCSLLPSYKLFCYIYYLMMSKSWIEWHHKSNFDVTVILDTGCYLMLLWHSVRPDCAHYQWNNKTHNRYIMKSLISVCIGALSGSQDKVLTTSSVEVCCLVWCHRRLEFAAHLNRL